MIQPTAVGKRVKLMMTCLCDALYPEVAKASCAVLEHVGCEVEVPRRQTCCGQPAFNAGDWESSGKVWRYTESVFSGGEPIVIPSGSCAAMLRHGALLAAEEDEGIRPVVEAMACRSWELAEFLVEGLGLSAWPGRFDARIALHRSCHTRGTRAYESAVRLLESIEGVELVPVEELEQCCGFGGTFCVSHPHVSKGMGELKIQHLTEPGPDVIVGVDMACLMHLGGLMEKRELRIPRMHLAQVLERALAARGSLAS